MIIGNNKSDVIENIKTAIEEEEYNKKVEIGDPNLSSEEKKKVIDKYLKRKGKITYKTNNFLARRIVNFFTWSQNIETEIVGLENIKDIKTGAIITSNHFNPLDSTIIRKFIKKIGKKNLYIVAQETNFAMTGLVGFIMNFADTIPISGKISYMKKDFPTIIENILNNRDYILIYPEQEMWFNYRKPRNLKPGAYHFAAKNNVPIISCFVEMIDKEEKDNEEFNKVKYVLHILEPIYPDKIKSIKENVTYMMEKDFEQKKEAYENAYGKKLDYKFEDRDIAGWRK